MIVQNCKVLPAKNYKNWSMVVEDITSQSSVVVETQYD